MSPSPTGPRKPLYCRVPERIHKKLARMSEETGYSVTELVIVAVERLSRKLREEEKHYGECPYWEEEED